MPSVLDVPEVVETEESYEETRVMPTSTSWSFRQWLGRLLTWPWGVKRVRLEVEKQACIYALIRRPDTPADIVARDYPYLYFQSLCG